MQQRQQTCRTNDIVTEILVESQLQQKDKITFMTTPPSLLTFNTLLSPSHHLLLTAHRTDHLKPLCVPLSSPYLGSLLLVGKLARPQDAMLRGDQQEAVSAVERARRGLHHAHLHMPPTCHHRHQSFSRTKKPEHMATTGKTLTESLVTFDMNEHQAAEGRIRLRREDV